MSIRAKHRNPAKPRQLDDRQVARAPYNFIPLPEKVMTLKERPGHDWYDETRYTGRVNCTLETRTPLFIRGQMEMSKFKKPDSEKKREQGYKDDNPEFFRDPLTNNHNPMIPASSLRGMLRSLVEIITFSKFGPVSERAVYFRSVADKTAIRATYQEIIERRQAGWIVEQDGRFAIRPAPEIAGRTYFKVSDKFAQERGIKFTSLKEEKKYEEAGTQLVDVFFVPGRDDRVVDISPTSGAGTVPGVMICSGPMKKKKKHWVVPKAAATKGEKLLWLTDEVVADYLNSLTDFQLEGALDRAKGLLSAFRTDKNGNKYAVNIPVFYVPDSENHGKVLAIGHTGNFRLPYQYEGKSVRLKDMVPDDLSLEGSHEKQVDMAETLFGYVKSKNADKNERAYRGRVRVSDGMLVGNDNPWLIEDPKDVVIPRILSGPKPTSYQHYLTQPHPDEVRWTDDKGNKRRRVELMHYGSPRSQAEPRGYKQYWHQPWVQSVDDLRAEPEKVTEQAKKQYTQIKPVKPEVRFKFSVQFENLNEMELGALLWALTLPTDSGECCHRLGMGKPLGLGSVKITVSGVECDDRIKRYETTWAKNGGWSCPQMNSAPGVAALIKTFEKQMSEKLGQPFRDQKRIQMLQKMLTWPGIQQKDKELIRYMEIKHEKFGNEYKDRPVLPDPLNLLGLDNPDPDAKPPKKQPSISQGSPKSTRQPIRPTRPNTTDIPTARDKPSKEAEDLFKALFKDKDEEED